MPAYRFQVSFGGDTAFPRDRMVIDPVFDLATPLILGNQGVNQLAQDLANALVGWSYSADREIEVNAYELGTGDSGPPKATFTHGEGLFPASTQPRELALCLSFFAGINTARTRGRLYIPATVLMGGGEDPGARPSGTIMQRVANLAPIFQDLGDTADDWSVYSPTTGQTNSVTNWWVDDEWDIIRGRGMRPTTRITGTTSEG